MNHREKPAPFVFLTACESCGSRDSRVSTSEERQDGTIYRKRICKGCGVAWSTIEVRCPPMHDVVVVSRALAQALQRSMMTLLDTLGDLVSYKVER